MELVIELVKPQKFGIDDESGKEVLQQAGNCDFFVEPFGEMCRGRWLKSQMHSDWADGNKIAKAAPEELPGYRIAIDIKARRVRVFDPLYGTPKGEDLARRFESIGQNLRLKRPTVFEGLAEAQLWVWLKWAARVVRDVNAEVISGEIPEMVNERIEQERQWDLDWYPDGGKKKHWEKEPSLDSVGGHNPKSPQKSAA